ncbi:hypothetical protein Ddep01_02271 [Deinococcus depolymerans]|uniref:hypothetical protein n=1 Tax=Deinococcus depolymerans TaxID=392408 RepID=UPI00309D4811
MLRRALSTLGWTAAGVAALGVANTYRFQITTHRAPLPGLTRPVRIAHLSDLHYGVFMRRRSVRRWVQATRQARPDVIVVTGTDGTYTLFVPGDWSGLTLRTDLSATETLTGLRLNGAATLAGDVSDPAVREYALPAPSGADQTLNAGLTGRATLSPDRSARGEAPLTVRYAHTFTPGTTGTVSFAKSGPFSGQVYLDRDCDGTVTQAERTPVGSVTVDDRWPRLPDGHLAGCALEVQVTVPAGTAVGTVETALVTASLTWANRPAVQDLASVTDTTTVTAGATLVKTVENRTRGLGVVASAVDALPGDRLRYCLNVRNPTADVLTGVTVSDALQGVAAYVPGTLTLEGVTLSDAPDTDAGEIVLRTVTVRLFDLAAGATQQVCFEVLVP